ncbi:mismatch repair ATPase (MutS family) [Owenweeksia hongkongensis DSM 17368]|uniref:Mismatch repair ATPase (MutS family) n=1 Tax=Owenweeksia hongkongensis (strain DSM 17368 / CIP 108786 / JCM 12287 / NRRL B-23963 / UST20020801) TaxID=926562 RepID=G8R535_OWEHD|nr:mismatch repair ATPase [Owenweeksia hongkongensis]AEV31046.1 mismatch repair ATPase (MutS family) [Owenweeksia hongkongensis DSM 17368]
MTQDFYKKKETGYKAILKQQKKVDRWFSALRFTLILLAAASGYGYLAQSNSLFLYGALFLLVAFVVALFRHLKLRKHITDLKNYIRLNNDEAAYLGGNLNPFDGAKELINGEHLFANDLDLFGHHSLFQHVNRTVTLSGKMKLADEFLSDSQLEIEAKQDGVKELAKEVDWRQGFAVAGMDVEENPALKSALDRWLKTESSKSIFTSSFLLYPLAGITFGLLVYWLVNTSLQSFTWLSYAFMANLAVVFLQFKNIKKEYEQLNKISQSLTLYSRLLKHIEEREFESTVLVKLKKRLETNEVSSSTALKKLSKLLDGFDQLNNVVALLFTNGLYHYHLHVLRGLYHWKKNHGSAIYEWLDVVAEFDQLNSKANFTFNHQEYVYPKLKHEKGLEALEMGHPLLSSHKRVSNDLNFDGIKYVILTGSNMSGKSTFLRTIGVNMVLMKLGMPVCAKEFSAYPFRLLTSMKLVDSLDKDESYFQAEVIRLKRIKDVLETAEPCLVLLDEILRGTNSDDKRNGTRLFMEKIGNYNALGVIATHDIDIAELAAQNATVFNAKYFESKVKSGELTFDYILRNGVCKTPNATDLMRAQGII